MANALLTFRGSVNSSHGAGPITASSEHIFLVSVNGVMKEVAVDGDIFHCPLCAPIGAPHCQPPLIGRGHAKAEGIKTVRVIDQAVCGATNFTPCDNTTSDEA